MAYSAPSTRSTSDLITAAIWNADLVANEIAIYAGALSVTSQAIGDILYASSTTQFARVAAVAAGQVLGSAGTGTVPAYSATPALTSVDMGGTTVYGSRAITVDTGGVLNIVLASAAGDDFTVDTSKLVVSGDSGHVGINTATPGGFLDVNGLVVFSGNTAGKNTFEFSTHASDEGRLRIKNVDTDTVQIRAGGDSYFNGGSVGIGTAAPISLLDVRGPVGTGATPAGLLTLATNELTVVDNDQLGRIEFRSPIATAGTDAIVSAAAIWVEANATFSASVNAADIVFATAASGAATEKMRILSSGNVGIGDPAPNRPLVVSGSASAVARFNSTAGTGTSIGWSQSGTQSFVIGAYSSITGSGTDFTPTFFSESGLGINFATGGAVTKRMEITSGGNVGIGVAVPDAKLDIDVGTGQIIIRTLNNNALTITENDADAIGGEILLRKSRGTYASPGDVVSGDNIGTITTSAYSGSMYFGTAKIDFVVDNTVSSNQRPPSRISFFTNESNGAVTERIRILSGGRVKMPAVYSVSGDGAALSIESDGNLYRIASARRYKDNINYDNVDGDLVYGLKPVSYTLKALENAREQVGFIAEDVEEIDPRLVVYSKEGTVDALHYDRVTVFLVKAMQDMKATYDARIAALESRASISPSASLSPSASASPSA